MEAFVSLMRAVRESSRKNEISGRILIGLSGGADSVALLCALSVLQSERFLQCAAIYVNHGLRPEALEEEKFCQRLCAKKGIPLQIMKVQVDRHGSLEAAARDARYSAFAKAMQTQQADVLALAHHMDDQAETVLMHLMYGAGADGLGGMPEYRFPIWRPLLGLRRQELHAALREIGQCWCEDASNADEAFRRNYIRRRVLPVMEEGYPQTVRALTRTADIVREENDLLRQMAAEWLGRHQPIIPWLYLPVGLLLRQHTAMQRRLLRMFVAEHCAIELDFSAVEQLREILHSNGEQHRNLPGGWHAAVSDDRLHFLPPQDQGAFQWDQMLLDRKPFSGFLGDGRFSQAMPKELADQTVLRAKRPGDRIQPFGMQGHMKIKDYFSARQIAPAFRSQWPLLCLKSDVLWVPGVGASERVRVHDAKTEDAVLLSFLAKLPVSTKE